MNNPAFLCIAIPVGIYVLGWFLMFLRVLFSEHTLVHLIVIPLAWPIIALSGFHT